MDRMVGSGKTDVVRSHSILVFLDSGTSHCLILDSFLVSPSILVCMDASRGISTESVVVITYIIRQIVSLHEERWYETVFQI